MHYHNRQHNPHFDFMLNARFDIVQMFTPPKSKSPWEAMTAGSTGGWAKGLEGAGWLGPVLGGIAAPFTGGLSLLGSVGMGMAGMAGKGTGFQGTDKGWSNIGSTLLGGLAGGGLGALGAGLGGGLGIGGMPIGASSTYTAGQTAANAGTWGQGLLGSFGSGFGQGVANYMAPATSLMGKIGNTFSGQQSAGGLQTEPLFSKNAAGQWNPITQGTTGTSGGNSLLGAVQSMLGGPSAGGMGEFNLGNAVSLIMGGAPALQAWQGGQTPRLQGNRDEAMAYINTPDLVQARNMFKDLAMNQPNQLLSQAGQTAIKNTLQQHRESVAAQQRLTVDQYAAKGQIAGKSGAVDKYLRDSEKNAMKQEMDYIAQANYSMMLADTKAKIEAVTAYYNVSADQAAQMLAAEGYVNPIDLQNYMAAVQEYQTAQQLSGYMQLAPLMKG